MKTQARKVGAESTLVAGHSEVGRHRKPKTTTDSRALNRSDYGLACAENTRCFDIDLAGLVGHLIVAPRLSRAEVRTSAKVLALGAQDNRAAVVRSVEGFIRVSDAANQLEVEEVIGRAMNFDCRYKVVD